MDRFRAARTVGILLASLLFASQAALGDELLLKSGGRLSGVIVERTATTISIETSPGRVTLPLSRVERISDARSALEVWRERAGALAAGDVSGWAALARWAEDQQLVTLARESWQRVLALDPRHPEANAALGRVSIDGTWMTRDDAFRAQGYVPFEGRWVTPAEHEALQRERQLEEERSRERREADLRAREAAARAREAEARARQADAAGESGDAGAIPIGWGGGYGPRYAPVDITSRPTHPHDGERHGGDHEGHRQPAVAAPPPSTPPSSIGPAARPPTTGGGSSGVRPGQPKPSTSGSR